MDIRIDALARELGAELVGDGAAAVHGVASLDAAGPGDVTFLADVKRRPQLRSCRAGAVLVAERMDGVTIPQLVVGDVNAALIHVLGLFAPEADAPPAEGVDPTARIAADVHLGQGVSIGAYAVLEKGAEIGDKAIIGAGSHVGREVRIGAGCRLGDHVVVHSRCCLGRRVVVQSHTVIGSIGFGYVQHDGQARLVPHIGNVVIEDDVEIGANCCIDRAKFGSTCIGAGTKIDNLVQIAHNVVIGRGCLIAALVGISGSCRLGDGVIMGGQVGVRDHLTIGDGAKIGGKSFVMRDVAPGQEVFGYPAMEKARALRALTVIPKLPEMAARLNQLERRSETDTESSPPA